MEIKQASWTDIVHGRKYRPAAGSEFEVNLNQRDCDIIDDAILEHGLIGLGPDGWYANELVFCPELAKNVKEKVRPGVGFWLRRELEIVRDTLDNAIPESQIDRSIPIRAVLADQIHGLLEQYPLVTPNYSEN